MVEHLLVTTTAPDRETAARLAASAVSAKLAATTQVHGPVTSFFWHLGERGEGEEWIATFKTTNARYSELEAHLIAEHAWKNPEVTAIKLERGAEGYLRWLEASTNSDRPLGTDLFQGGRDLWHMPIAGQLAGDAGDPRGRAH